MGRPPTIGGLAPKPLHRLASLADFQTTITQFDLIQVHILTLVITGFMVEIKI